MKAYIVEFKISTRVVAENKDYAYHKAIDKINRYCHVGLNDVSKLVEDKQNPFGSYHTDPEEISYLKQRILELEKKINLLNDEHVD